MSAGKEGEVYIFGGLVKDKRKNDLFVIDSGTPFSMDGLTFREYDGLQY